MTAPQSNLFGKLAVALGYITEAQLQECIGLQSEYLQKGREYMRIGEILEMKGYLGGDAKNRLLSINLKKPKTLFGETAVQLQHCTQADVDAALATQADLRARGKQMRIGEVLVSNGKLQKHQVPVLLNYQHLVKQYESETSSPAIPVVSERPSPMPPGSDFSGYRIRGVLGEDDFGYTYLADDKTRDRHIALRVLNPDICARPNLVGQIKQNLIALKNLRNKHIRSVIRLGQTDKDTVSIALAYVEGRSLYQVVREDGPLPWRKAVEYAIQTAQGLSDAMEAFVQHEDLRPSHLLLAANDNIVINNLGLRAGVKTGLFRFAEQDSQTPCYLAPESVMPDTTPDHRADIFSLGMTLYFLCTGEHMLKGNSPMEALLKLSFGDAASIREAVPDAPAELDAVLNKMCQPEPDQRFQRFNELIDALRRALKAGAAPQLTGAQVYGERPTLKQSQAGMGDLPDALEPPGDWQMDTEGAQAFDDEPVEEDDDAPPAAAPPERLRRKKGLLDTVNDFLAGHFGGFFRLSWDSQGCLVPSLLLLVVIVGGIKAYPWLRNTLRRYDLTTPGEITFEEPQGSYSQRIAFYEAVENDPNSGPRRKDAATVKRKEIKLQMDGAGRNALDSLRAGIAAQMKLYRFDLAVQMAESFPLSTYYTPEWAEEKHALMKETADAVDAGLEALRAEMQAAVHARRPQDLTGLAARLGQADAQAVKDIRAEALANAKTVQAELDAEAGQRNLAASQAAWTRALETDILPALRLLDIATAQKRIAEAQSNADKILVKEHLDAAGELAAQLRDFSAVYRRLCSASGRTLAGGTWRLRHNNAGYRLIAMGETEWRVAPDAGGDELRLPPSRLDPETVWRLLANVAVADGSAKDCLEITRMALLTGNPLPAAAAYKQATGAGLDDAALSAALRAAGRAWLETSLPKDVTPDAIAAWLRLRNVNAGSLLFDDAAQTLVDERINNYLRSLVKNQDGLAMLRSSFADAGDKDRFEYTLGAPELDGGTLLFRQGANARLKQSGVGAVALLLQLPEEKGTVEIEVGDMVVSVESAQDSQRLRSRIGMTWKALDNQAPDRDWHLLVFERGAEDNVIRFDGVEINRAKRGDGVAELRIVVSGKSVVRFDDITVWQ